MQMDPVSPPAYPPSNRPKLKSTFSSRESQFELDDNELDEEDADLSLSSQGLDVPPKRSVERARDPNETDDDQEGPLLQGLLADGVNRGSVDVESGEPWKEKGSTLIAGIASESMANSILGAGIIGLPYSFRQSGLVSGVILLVVLGWVTDWTVRLIILNAKLSGSSTYIGIMDVCFGYPGRAACSFFMFAFAFGGMCAFEIIVGDTLPHVLTSVIPASTTNGFLQFIFSRNFVIAFFTLSVSYPLSLYRDIEKLSKASAMALLSMVFILLTVAAHGPGLPTALKGTETFTIIQADIPAAIAVISFAFICHHNTLLIYGSLAQPTIDRFANLTHFSTGFSVIASLAMAIFGFTVFGEKTQGNVLNNFPADDTWTNIARACFGMNMFVTLPLECFVCREVLETFFFSGQPFSTERHFAITTALVMAAMIVSLFVEDLGAVLEIGGGLAAALLAYVFPAACYLRLSGDISTRSRWAARICIAFGLVVAVSVLVKTLWRTWSPSDASTSTV